jgi:CheY-like chemotaxis protein
LLDQALAAGVGLSDLLNDIIDFSDVEAGRLELACEPIDPREQLDSILAMFRPQADAKGLTLAARCQADLGWVAGDPARLRKIFFHFISNAVKFTDAGGIEARLSASGAGEARRLRLEVEDTGVGVAKEARDTLFERFNQADASTTRRYGGPGLGLAITRRLAELMGGSVGYESRVGEGSTFWAEISAPAAAEAGPANEDAAADWLAGVKVLVVEDNATNRLVATRMLSQMGAEVTTAENGADGVAAIEQADFDLVFMDIQMPVMDGVEATRRIRALGGDKSQVPIVATTANVMPQQLETYRQSGINGVVAKPISPAALLAEVARVASEAEAA